MIVKLWLKRLLRLSGWDRETKIKYIKQYKYWQIITAIYLLCLYIVASTIYKLVKKQIIQFHLGNITAAFWAKQKGFPIDEISMSLNTNDTVVDYLETCKFNPKASVETLANAMDVGNPSNFERLLYLLGNYESFKHNVKAVCISDFEIIEKIKQIYRQYDEIVCQHTATGFVAKSQFDANKDLYNRSNCTSS